MEEFAIARADHLAGVPLPQWIQEASERGSESRKSTVESMKAFEHAVMVFRSKTVHALVDEHGMSMTEVARLFRTTRQNIARLYHATEERDG
jgi:hypothetical protein